LGGIGGGSCICVGMIGEVISRLLESEDGELKAGAVWMTGEEGDEEKKRKIGMSSMLVRRMEYLVDEYVLFPTSRNPKLT